METQRKSLSSLGLLALTLLATSPAAHAGQRGAAQMGPPPPPALQTSVPNVEQLYVLVRSTLLTLDNAVQTGNFTVLRDQAAPSFSAANNSARLARIFQNLGQQGVDLSRAAITAPTINRLKLIDQGRRLRVSGAFAGSRSRIDFDLIFEMSGGRWRLFGISVNPEQVVPGNNPSPVHAQPAPTSPTTFPRYAPDWDVVSNTRQ